jgi:hypothetical protein
LHGPVFHGEACDKLLSLVNTRTLAKVQALLPLVSSSFRKNRKASMGFAYGDDGFGPASCVEHVTLDIPALVMLAAQSMRNDLAAARPVPFVNVTAL